MIDQRKAIFLDRDGTLIEEVGILNDPCAIRLFPDTVEALRTLQKNYLLFVVTNQSAVSQGKLSLDQVDAVNNRLDEMLSREGVTIQEWYVCPHSREDNCTCIKPKSGYILKAAIDYRLDLKKSFVIGDHPHDALTGNELGVYGLYLLTGHGGRHLSDLPADKLVFHRLRDATEWILNHPDHEKDTAKRIEAGAAAIQSGMVVAFPTETVYGLGADVFNPNAVSRLFEIKKRPKNNPLIAHISDFEQVDLLARSVPDAALRLMKTFWPGPLTIVLPKKTNVPDIVTAGNPTVAIRMPANPIARDLIQRSGTPIAAPSANAFSCTSPTTARHVEEQLGNQCAVVIDGGACRVGVESTVVSLTGVSPVILRPGGISSEEIEAEIGSVHTACTDADGGAESPGLLPNHYAPETPLSLYSEIPCCFEKSTDVGILLFEASERTFSGVVEVLSVQGDANEASVNFYAAIRRLDVLGLRKIVVQRAPESGLGTAINNRLVKASRGRSE